MAGMLLECKEKLGTVEAKTAQEKVKLDLQMTEITGAH